METKTKTNLIITTEFFEDEAGNKISYVCFTMELSKELFKLVPLKKDKKLISYLLNRKNVLKDGVYETELTLSQDQFKDKVTHKTIDYVSYTFNLLNKDFRLYVRDEDKSLVKFLLEEDYGFFIDSVNGELEEDDDE